MSISEEISLSIDIKKELQKANPLGNVLERKEQEKIGFSTAVYIIPIQNGEIQPHHISINIEKEDKRIPGLSVAKLFIASYALQEIDKGTTRNDEKPLSLATFVPVSRSESGSPTRTMKALLQDMIHTSNNDATQDLADFFGRRNIQDYIQSLGLTQSSIFVPEEDVRATITPRETALFLSRIWNKELLTERSRDFLLRSMRNATMPGVKKEDIFPFDTYPHAVFYHKVGGEVQKKTGTVYFHDASIILLPKEGQDGKTASGGIVVFCSKRKDVTLETQKATLKKVYSRFLKHATKTRSNT
ncbi:MAG TPA: serine hydrolase [Patescibacteria group bacterium]|nr:serine hydrolase [Patescibacteria group bacterium]